MNELVITTSNLRQYQSVYTKISDKNAGINGAVHLNFEDGIFSFRGDSSFFQSSLFFQGKGIGMEGVYIMEGEKFFAMIRAFDEVVFNGNFFSTEDGSKFYLNIVEGPAEYPVFQESENFTEIPFNYSDLRKPLSQIELALNDNGDHYVFFHNDEILSLHESNFVRLKNTFSVEEDFSLPSEFFSVVKWIQSSIANNPTLRIHKKEDSLLLHYKDENDSNWNSLYYSVDSTVEFPVDPDDPEFISSYMNEHYFVIDGYKLSESVSFLDPFSDGLKNDVISIKTLASEKHLVLFVNDDSNSVEYNLPVEEFSDDGYFEQETINLSFKKLKSVVKALKVLSAEVEAERKVTIRYDIDGPTVTFSSSLRPEDVFVKTVTE